MASIALNAILRRAPAPSWPVRAFAALRGGGQRRLHLVSADAGEPHPDHRVIYGTHGAAFLKDSAALIETDPESLAL